MLTLNYSVLNNLLIDFLIGLSKTFEFLSKNRKVILSFLKSVSVILGNVFMKLLSVIFLIDFSVFESLFFSSCFNL